MPALKYWDGSAWQTLGGGVPIYEQPSDPGAVQNGSIWIDTDANPAASAAPALRLHKGSAQSINNSAVTKVTWSNAATEDGGDWWNVATPDLIVIPEAGFYLLTANLFFGNQSGARDFFFGNYDSSGERYVESDQPVPTGTSTAGGTYINATTAKYFVAGHRLALYAYQTSGAAVNVGGTTEQSGNVSITKLGIGPKGDSGTSPIVTSLPASPFDGQEVSYLADATNGVVWRLRYRSGASGSYKWEFVGGPPLHATVDTGQSVVSAPFTDLATVGPSVTVPLIGDYDVQISADIFASQANNGQVAIASFAVGAVGALDVDGVSLYRYRTDGVVSDFGVDLTKRRRKTVTVPSTAITMKYKTGTQTQQFSERTITVWPVRVG